ncbi:MAG: hypothetical protein IPL62_06980 [Caulobacteraceae bacterium]|nr:hypothetical protein [Caulobacteraceae bacterium]
MIALAWLALAMVHAPPALATFSSGLRKRMYGVDGPGPLGVILIHRGVLFLAVACVSVLAAFNADARIAAMLVMSISVLGFLMLTPSPARPNVCARSRSLTLLR